MITDGGFETGFNKWYISGSGVIEYIFDENSPEGNRHIKISGRETEAAGLMHDIKITDELYHKEIRTGV
jgi:hypothetical protein